MLNFGPLLLHKTDSNINWNCLAAVFTHICSHYYKTEIQQRQKKLSGWGDGLSLCNLGRV